MAVLERIGGDSALCFRPSAEHTGLSPVVDLSLHYVEASSSCSYCAQLPMVGTAIPQPWAAPQSFLRLGARWAEEALSGRVPEPLGGGALADH